MSDNLFAVRASLEPGQNRGSLAFMPMCSASAPFGVLDVSVRGDARSVSALRWNWIKLRSWQQSFDGQVITFIALNLVGGLGGRLATQLLTAGRAGLRFVYRLTGAGATARTGVVGIPGPGVGQAHLAGVRTLAQRAGVPVAIHGSRQTGIRASTGTPYTRASDLDLGVVGGADELVAVVQAYLDGAQPLHAMHVPMVVFESVAQARRAGALVVLPL